MKKNIFYILLIVLVSYGCTSSSEEKEEIKQPAKEGKTSTGSAEAEEEEEVDFSNLLIDDNTDERVLEDALAAQAAEVAKEVEAADPTD